MEVCSRKVLDRPIPAGISTASIKRTILPLNLSEEELSCLSFFDEEMLPV